MKNRQSNDIKTSERDIGRAPRHPAGCGESFSYEKQWLIMHN
ncbi:hypothetical protein CBFG_00606 [Clostridiales bacterium 1_7_47FAA]|nr:hypothetical protein CBFG_00606 [Clostridiales bacterium 1_7_47FAA]